MNNIKLKILCSIAKSHNFNDMYIKHVYYYLARGCRFYCKHIMWMAIKVLGFRSSVVHIKDKINILHHPFCCCSSLSLQASTDHLYGAPITLGLASWQLEPGLT